MDDSDTPPSSPSLSHRSRMHGDSTRKARKSSKDHTRSYADHSSKELIKLLVYEEQESKDLRYSLQSLTSRLKDETHRADTAEQRAKEAVMRFKEANDARVGALHDAARVKEELSLYKLQLEHAQREITRAQELLDAIEALRYEAEEDAARARSTARRLKEEKVIALARDEGRREGYEEGLTRGREIGFEEGRAAAYAQRANEARELRDATNTSMPRKEKPLRATKSSSSLNITLRPPPPDLSTLPSTTVPSTTVGRTTTTGTASVTQPRTVTSSATRSASMAPSQTESPIHPVPVRNMMTSPGHIPIDYPPDGFIPTIDEDARIRLPPPHELAPAPPTPQATPPLESIPVSADAYTPPPLMVPPPIDRTEGGSISENEYGASYMHALNRAEAEVKRRPRRRRSSDSQSTTFSQFDLLSQQGPPVAHSGRINLDEGGRPNVLSAIQEERASSLASSPYAAPSPHRDQQLMPSPIVMPSPQVPPTPSVARDYNENHARSESRMSQPRDNLSRSESRASAGQGHGRGESKGTLSPPKSHHTLSRKGSVSSQLSNAGFNITVEPPSRPESTPSITTAYHGGLLSSADAERPSSTEPPAVVVPSPTVPPPTPDPFYQPAPIPLSDGQLPPGFIATSPLPPGFVPSAASTPTPQPMHPNYTSASQSTTYTTHTGAGVPLPPSSAGSVYRAYMPAQSVAGSSAPTVLPGSGPTSTYPSAPPSTVSGVAPSGPAPPVIPITPTSHRYSRSALPGQSSTSTSSSSQEDLTGSSDDSSDTDSLTTPPERRRPLLGTPGTIPGVGGVYGVPVGGGASRAGSPSGGNAGYAVAPVPQGVVYPSTSPVAPYPQTITPHSTGSTESRPRTAQAARVPLPASVTAPSTRATSTTGSPARTTTSVGTTSAAARVPLPPSSVGGSERSAYTRVVPNRPRDGGSAVGGSTVMSPLLIPTRGM